MNGRLELGLGDGLMEKDKNNIKLYIIKNNILFHCEKRRQATIQKCPFPRPKCSVTAFDIKHCHILSLVLFCFDLKNS